MKNIKNQINKNRKYNAERKRMNEIFMRDVDHNDFIRKVHQEAWDRIQYQIDTFYMNYARSERISLKEAKKRAAEMDVRKFQEKAKKAVKERDFSQKTNYWLKIYNLKMKVSRLELLKAEISLELNSMYDYDYKYMWQTLHDEIVDELENQAGIMANSAMMTEDQINKIIMMDFHGKGFSERIWGKNGYYQNSEKEIFRSLQNIFTDMGGYQKERDRLKKLFGLSEYQVMRLLKTEVSRVNSQSRDQMYKSNGFTHYRYVCEPGACEICKPLDGKIFKMEDREIGVSAAPLHPNCRCRDYGIIELRKKDGTSNIDGDLVEDTDEFFRGLEQ